MNPYEFKPHGRYTETCGREADADFAFRAAIGEVTADVGAPLDKRCDVIAALARKRGRSVRRDAVDASIEDIRCFGYCLGLASHWKEMKVMDAAPTDRFIYWLVQRELLTFKEVSDAMADGDLVIYHASNYQAQHAGRFQGGRVISKWGGLPVFVHGLWDVPASYGNMIRGYGPIKEDLVWREFCAWVQDERGKVDS